MSRLPRRLVITVVLFLGSGLMSVAVSEPDGAAGTPGRPSHSGVYDHDQLQRDARMIQTMSTPNANTDSQYHRHDVRLTHGRDPAFVRDVEAHQADIDRMLARPGR